MLTARDELPDKIAGFRAGADDYLTAVRAARTGGAAGGAVAARRAATAQAPAGGRPGTGSGNAGGPAWGQLHLYPACRKLLEVLMRASPGAVTRQQLEFALWDAGW